VTNLREVVTKAGVTVTKERWSQKQA
jgi:hypothetical protein